jgi:hypothetical protein
MSRKHLGLPSLILMALSPVVASAQPETLDYVGSAFTSVTISGNLTNGLHSLILENTGEVVLSSLSAIISTMPL